MRTGNLASSNESFSETIKGHYDDEEWKKVHFFDDFHLPVLRRKLDYLAKRERETSLEQNGIDKSDEDYLAVSVLR